MANYDDPYDPYDPFQNDPYDLMFKVVRDLNPDEEEDPEIREYIMRLDIDDPLRVNYFAIYNQLDPEINVNNVDDNLEVDDNNFVNNLEVDDNIPDDTIPDDNIPDIILYNNRNNKKKTNKRVIFKEPSFKLSKNNDKDPPDTGVFLKNDSVSYFRNKHSKSKRKPRKSRSKSKKTSRNKSQNRKTIRRSSSYVNKNANNKNTRYKRRTIT